MPYIDPCIAVAAVVFIRVYDAKVQLCDSRHQYGVYFVCAVCISEHPPQDRVFDIQYLYVGVFNIKTYYQYAQGQRVVVFQ